MYTLLKYYCLNYFLGIISTGANIGWNFHHLEDTIWDRAVPCFLLRKVQFYYLVDYDFRVQGQSIEA